MSGSVANQIGRSNNNVFITFDRIIRLQTNYIRDVLISRRFLLVRPFPALQIPDLKTPAAAHESDLTFQSNLLAKLFRQDKAPLSIRNGVLRAGVQLAQENPTIARGNPCSRPPLCAPARNTLARAHAQVGDVPLAQGCEPLRRCAPST